MAESRHRRILAPPPTEKGFGTAVPWGLKPQPVASRASEDQRSCLLWKPALGDRLRERPCLPGLPVRSPGLCRGQGPGVRASSPSGERQPQAMPRVCKENRPTEPFPKSAHGTRSEIEGVVCAPRLGWLIPSQQAPRPRVGQWALLQEKLQAGSRTRTPGRGGAGRASRSGAGEGLRGRGASLQAGGKAPWYAAAASSPTLSCGAVEDAQAGRIQKSQLASSSCLGLNMKREMSSPGKER